MAQIQKVVITGGTGLLGRYVVQTLSSKYTVTVADINVYFSLLLMAMHTRAKRSIRTVVWSWIEVTLVNFPATGSMIDSIIMVDGGVLAS